MKRRIVNIAMAAVVCVALTAGTTMAQNGRFSVGAELGLPMGDFGDGAGIGFGGTVRYEHPLGDKMGLTGTVGYMVFTGKTVDVLGVDVKGESTGIIPIQVGFKYYFNEAQDGFYAMAQLGVHMSMVKVPTYDSNGDPLGTETQSNTNLSYAPEIGYHLANLDFGLRYQLLSHKQEFVTFDPQTLQLVTDSKTSTWSYVGLRVAYVFGEK